MKNTNTLFFGGFIQKKGTRCDNTQYYATNGNDAIFCNITQIKKICPTPVNTFIF